MMKKEILIEQSHLDYLEKFRCIRNFSSINKAIRTVIEQHEQYLSHTDGSVAHLMTEVLEESTLKPIRLAVNNIDRNTQILIELLNALFFAQGIDPAPTSLYVTEALAKARKDVQERILNQQQRKWDG